MAKSTGLVVAAGAISMADVILADRWDPAAAVRVGVASIAAGWVSAGLDKLAPGFGTGAAVLLLLSVLLKSGPHIATKVFPGTDLSVSAFEKR